jgi:hypothetical protein
MGFAFLSGEGGKAACGLKTRHLSTPKPPKKKSLNVLL